MQPYNSTDTAPAWKNSHFIWEISFPHGIEYNMFSSFSLFSSLSQTGTDVEGRIGWIDLNWLGLGLDHTYAFGKVINSFPLKAGRTKAVGSKSRRKTTLNSNNRESSGQT